MAIIIPNLRLGNAKATPGEQRLAHRLESLLDDATLCFYDIPVGKRRRYPDFIIVHPRRGLLFLEVKDWMGTASGQRDCRRREGTDPAWAPCRGNAVTGPAGRRSNF